MLNAPQFRELVVRPTLQQINRWSPAAEALVFGTAVHESRLVYLHQVGGGPALGLYQIEPATHADVWANFLKYKTDLASAIAGLAVTRSDVELIRNLAYATGICRAIYARATDPLPAAGDVDGLAAYWKAHFNTPLGKGNPADWAQHFRDAIGV